MTPSWRRPRFILLAVVTVLLFGYAAGGAVAVWSIVALVALGAFVYFLLAALGALWQGVRREADRVRFPMQHGIQAVPGPSSQRSAAASRPAAGPMRDRNMETLSATESSLVRAYHANNANAANKLFALDAAQLGRSGWSPTSQTWAVGNPGIGRMLAVGILAFAARPNGTLTVIYARAAVTKPASAPSPTFDIPGQIRRLGELRDAGMLTSEEFDAKKGELLGRM